MKHELLLLGKTKDRFVAEGMEEYASRLRHYTSFSATLIKERSRPRGPSVIDSEGMLLMQAVTPGALIVVLDPKGKQFTSEGFARQIAEWELQGVKQVCYLIGGPDGHSSSVLQAAGLVFSMSQMTFTHDMIRMLLVEQLYRAYTIKGW